MYVLSMYVSMYECTYLCVMSWAVLFKIVLSFDYIVANVTLISNFLVVDVPYVLVKVAFCIERFRWVTYLTCVHNPTPSFVLHPCFTNKVLLTIFVASPHCLCVFYCCPLLADLKYYIYVIPWAYLRLLHINCRMINTLSKS